MDKLIKFSSYDMYARIETDLEFIKYIKNNFKQTFLENLRIFFNQLSKETNQPIEQCDVYFSGPRPIREYHGKGDQGPFMKFIAVLIVLVHADDVLFINTDLVNEDLLKKNSVTEILTELQYFGSFKNKDLHTFEKLHFSGKDIVWL